MHFLRSAILCAAILGAAVLITPAISATGAGSVAPPAEGDLPILTNVVQIRLLTPNEAQKAFPVKLRGVVTYYDVRANDLFLQDATAGIYVVLNPESCSKLVAGQSVEIAGTTDVGDFAPVVKARDVHVTGHVPLPFPQQVTMNQLFTGKEDSQWIEVDGVVRSATVLADRKYLNLAMDGQRLMVSIENLDQSNATEVISKYIGTMVRVRGVCYSRYNSLGQFWLPWVAVASLDDVTVERPSSDPPKVVSIANLARFNSRGYYGNRVKVTGVVTLQKDDGAVFIQDNGRGLCVLLAQSRPLAPGDRIMVSGYTALGDYIPILEDATVEVLGHGQAPTPVAVDLGSLLGSPEKFDYVLVRVQANLVNVISGPAQETLVLEASNTVITAGIANGQAGGAIKSLRDGSQLALTGIFIAQAPLKWIPGFIPSREKPGSNPFYFPPDSVQVLLRAPEDIAVLHHPSWWTLARLLWVVGVMMLALLIGFAWVVALDRRVRRQTQIITEKVRREGMMEERDRIAREFHDTLEQELVAITMQLDAIKAQSADASPKEQRHLELARSMSRRSLSEAKRSVWALRSHMLENCNLESALKEVADPLFHETGIEIFIAQTGTPRKLPALTEHNLLRIGQEGLANAFKHSCAKKINVSIAYEPNLVRLSICDDGMGFDLETAGSARRGHFGLLDMRERAEKIGGAFSITSHRGGGTKLVITVVTTHSASPGSNHSANGKAPAVVNGDRDSRA
jgi:signal transduction histidine kinase